MTDVFGVKENKSRSRNHKLPNLQPLLHPHHHPQETSPNLRFALHLRLVLRLITGPAPLQLLSLISVCPRLGYTNPTFFPRFLCCCPYSRVYSYACPLIGYLVHPCPPQKWFMERAKLSYESKCRWNNPRISTRNPLAILVGHFDYLTGAVSLAIPLFRERSSCYPSSRRWSTFCFCCVATFSVDLYNITAFLT